MEQLRWLKVPLILGAAPLITGISLFLLWVFTEWRWLPIAGMFVICAGFASVVSGLVYLGAGILKRIRSGTWLRVSIGPAVLVGAVLISNFPVCYGLFWAGVHIATTYTVVVRNHASTPIEKAALNGGGVSLQIGQIKAGATITSKSHITQDGTLIFSAEQNGSQIGVLVDSYVTNSSGGHKEIDVSADGSISVGNLRADDN